MFLQIWVQKSASGVIERSCSHLFDGKTVLLSECDIILYIWERSLLGEWILTNCEISVESKRFVVLMLILD